MKLLDFFHQTKTQAILAFVIVLGVGSLLEFGHLTEGINNRILDIALLTATFYFGGSKSSSAKDDTINMLSKAPPATTNTGDINITQTKDETVQ